MKAAVFSFLSIVLVSSYAVAEQDVIVMEGPAYERPTFHGPSSDYRASPRNHLPTYNRETLGLKSDGTILGNNPDIHPIWVEHPPEFDGLPYERCGEDGFPPCQVVENPGDDTPEYPCGEPGFPPCDGVDPIPPAYPVDPEEQADATHDEPNIYLPYDPDQDNDGPNIYPGYDDPIVVDGPSIHPVYNDSSTDQWNVTQ